MKWLALVWLVGVVAMWWAMRKAPTVYPEACPFTRIRNGREECGGPCCRGALPCAPEEA